MEKLFFTILAITILATPAMAEWEVNCVAGCDGLPAARGEIWKNEATGDWYLVAINPDGGIVMEPMEPYDETEDITPIDPPP